MPNGFNSGRSEKLSLRIPSTSQISNFYNIQRFGKSITRRILRRTHQNHYRGTGPFG